MYTLSPRVLCSDETAKRVGVFHSVPFKRPQKNRNGRASTIAIRWLCDAEWYSSGCRHQRVHRGVVLCFRSCVYQTVLLGPE